MGDKKIDFEIVVYHVGGGGSDYGPVEKLMSLKNVKKKFYIFDPREELEILSPSLDVDKSSEINEITNKKLEIIYIRQAIGGFDGNRVLNIFADPLASSLLLPSNDVKQDNPGYSPYSKHYTEMPTWGAMTEIVQTENFNTLTLSSVRRKNNLENPDILSMDIQGIEFEVLQGNKDIINEEVCLVSVESEFFPIYKDQGLFSDQLNLLNNLNFRLMEFAPMQYWYPGPIVGKGFPTVTESVFIRDFRKFYKDSRKDRIELFKKLFKIALIAYAFERYSYYYSVLNFSVSEFGSEFYKFIHDLELDEYLELYLKMEKFKGFYNSDPNYYFQKFHINFRFIDKVVYLYKKPLNFIIRILKLRGIIWRLDNLENPNSRG